MKTLEEMPELMTLREVAQFLRISIVTVKRWNKKGDLPCIRINSRGDRRYHRSTIADFLEKGYEHESPFVSPVGRFG